MENWYYWSLEISNPLYIHDDTLTLLQRSVKNIIFFCKMKYFLKERNVGIFSKRITKLILLVRKIITQFFGSFVMFFLQCIRSSYVQNCNGLVLLLKCIEKIQKSGQIDVITSSPIRNKKKNFREIIVIQEQKNHRFKPMAAGKKLGEKMLTSLGYLPW